MTPDPVLDKDILDYLLGGLPAEKIERFDELSIVDDSFALRLREVEHDLMDAYVRDQLSGEVLERFRSHYLSSPLRGERVTVARALMHAQSRRRVLPFRSKELSGAEEGLTENSPVVSSGRIPGQIWKRAIAAGLLLVVASALGFVALRGARKTNTVAGSAPAQTLPLAAAAVPQPNTTPEVKSETRAGARPLHPPPAFSSILLLPETRGAQQVMTIPVPAGEQVLSLRLKLEGDDFPLYRVTLRDLSEDRVVWTSPTLHSRGKGPEATVQVSVPAHLAHDGRYAAELIGEAKGADSEFLSSYIFTISRR